MKSDSLLSFYQLGSGMGTSNRDLSQKCVAQVKSWRLYSTVSITQAPSLITSLCMIFVPKMSSQFSIAAGAPTIKSCLPVTGRRDKDKKHLPVIFSEDSWNLLLCLGQNLGMWPHLDGRLPNVFILDDHVPSQKSRALLLWKKES